MFLIGLLNAQYTFTGYDASAHVSEETVNARISAPKGIVNSIWISMVAGFILLLGVSMAIPTAFPVTINGVEYAGYDAIATDLVPWATIFEYATGHSDRPAARPHRDRRAVLLRHVVDHRQLAHGVRLRP